MSVVFQRRNFKPLSKDTNQNNGPSFPPNPFTNIERVALQKPAKINETLQKTLNFNIIQLETTHL